MTKRPRLVIAAPSSGSGKTTVTVGLMAAFRRRGLTVQGFKVGPDYIDPSYHTAITGRPSRNLDSWMMSHAVLGEVFDRGSRDADLSVIEGVMGLFDGKEATGDQASTAEVSRLLKAPVILVVDVGGMAASAAAVVLGFQWLDPRVSVAGVIANRVGSEGHYHIIKQAIERVTGVPVLGYLLKSSEVTMPSRHLGLIPAIERGELSPLFNRLADLVARTVDLDAIWRMAERYADWDPPDPILFAGEPKPAAVSVAVARDRAFNFYYPENLDLLRWHGAEIVPFRPLEGEPVPAGADALYLGGGFPEEFLPQLSAQNAVHQSVRRAVEAGMPVVAECGGYMYLMDAIVDKNGERYPMAGVIPAVAVMEARLVALGYREVTALSDNALLLANERARGHEFHYSSIRYGAESWAWPYAFEVSGRRQTRRDGYAEGRLLASYMHLHFASHPAMVTRFIEAAKGRREARR
ncbi:cobyrinic acid A,C-diamide synthase [Sulfobacillus acidophilus TPY]|uniref:Cobyrinate a,c-diamide synthase n=1 Tax=Sulfobacillus acidophilus (strain ATCC 700253 / DSM 10332 / NAL) TaxID=679936 RepID=G8TU80_SULAD|nr:cobyrinic acid A,C-diamide synthase [Sulfobacillus acidophilus TPY]AEW05752.1 Cobyrinic acid A,C-diamide synthase [Sulfobacillus acidophilus DSM 10332]